MTLRCPLDEAGRLELICETIRYCQRVRGMGGPIVIWTKALREAVYHAWEARRGSRERAARYRSVSSRGLTFGSNKIVYDHAVPLKLVHAELMGLTEPDIATVRKILDRMLCACIVTVDENRAINQAGLGREMPTGWDGRNLLARYEAVKIAIEDNSRWAFATQA